MSLAGLEWVANDTFGRRERKEEKKTLNRRRRPLFPLPARRGGAVRLS